MKKILAVVAVLVVVAIVGAALYLRSNLDRLVKEAIERQGSAALGTSVRVGSVSISLREGRATVRGLRVANPEGYSRGDAFELGEAAVQIDAASVTKRPIVVPEVTIRAPEVEYEMAANGKSNIDVLLAHARSGSGKGGGGAQSGGTGGEARPVTLSIGRFTFEQGHVGADLEAVGSKTFETDLPPVRVSNLRGTPQQISQRVAEEFLRSVTRAVARGRAEKLIDEKVGGEAGEAAKSLLNKVLK